MFTAAEQAAAFEAYIQQDPYLSKHRGEYAERGGMFLPMFNSMDLSVIAGHLHATSAASGTPASSASTSPTSATC